MNIDHKNVWDMLRAIRSYTKETGLTVRAVDDKPARFFRFVTDCPETDPQHRTFSIGITYVIETGNKRERDLDGTPVTETNQHEALIRCMKLFSVEDGRKALADILSHGMVPA